MRCLTDVFPFCSAEANYPLIDKDGEKKFGFKLAVALENVKHNKGKLFEGHTFYISSKLKTPDPTLVKNVIVANGGIVSLLGDLRQTAAKPPIGRTRGSESDGEGHEGPPGEAHHFVQGRRKGLEVIG